MINFNNGTITFNSHWLKPSKLPPFTLRLLYADGETPIFQKGTGVQISSSPNIWDLTYNNTDWSYLLNDHGGAPYYIEPGIPGWRGTLLEIIDGNTTGVTDLSWAFSNCKYLRSIPLLDTSSVTSMYYTFHNNAAMTSFPLFDTHNVIEMVAMFDNCTSIKTIPLYDTSNCRAFGAMFMNCTNLESIPLLDTSKGGLRDVQTLSTDMDFYGMFARCSKLTTIPLIDTSHGQDFIYMFEQSGIVTCPELDTSSGRRFTAMFNACYDLTEIPVFDYTSLTRNEYSTGPKTDNMFMNCYNVTGGAYANYLRIKAVADANGWDSSYTFTNCGRDTVTGAAELAQIPYVWGGTGA